MKLYKFDWPTLDGWYANGICFAYAEDIESAKQHIIESFRKTKVEYHKKCQEHYNKIGFSQEQVDEWTKQDVARIGEYIESGTVEEITGPYSFLQEAVS